MSSVTAIRNPEHHASDNAASAAGYTLHMIGMHGGWDGEVCVLVRPDASFDDLITAFDTDEQEWVLVKAWEFEWVKA